MFSKFLKLFYFFFVTGFIGSLVVLGIVFYISFDLPQINSLSDYNPPIPSRILSHDGEVLLEVGKERRSIAQFEEIPTRVVGAFLAAEDDNFYNHGGVDYVGIMRAMVKNIMAGRIVQGASTITQQVAKSLLLSNARTFTRKIKDLLLAKRIEEKFTKDEILYLYLNQVYLGGGYYGVKAAFKGYFGKELKDASIAESALVAGLLVAPGRYSPYINPEYAKKRQRYVLGRMLATNKITQLEYDQAIGENIKLMTRQFSEEKAGYFTDWVRQRVIEKVGSERFLTDGFEVKTTLNWKLQRMAEKSVYEGIRQIDHRQGFKGPIGHLDDLSQLTEKNRTFRKKEYKERSDYFTFKADATTEYQYNLGDDELTSDVLEIPEGRDYKAYFQYGQNSNDPYLKLVSNNILYDGVVTKVSNSQRLIYIDFAGLKGVIPAEYFSWAHERYLSDEYRYFAPIKNPSEIVKVGDIVKVKIVHNPTSLWGYVFKSFKTKKLSSEFLSDYKKQKFFILSLEQEIDSQGALLSIRPHSGDIIALVGGLDFATSKFNRVVQSNRQPGSSFKPIIYATALENGYTPASILLDSPQALAAGMDHSINWKPRNYDGKFRGPMTFRRALEISRNIPTIKIVQDVGTKKVFNFVERIGIDVEMPNDLSIALGSFGINLLQMVKAYALFPNGGKTVNLKSVVSITDRYGTIYYLDSENPEQDSHQKDVELPSEEEMVAKITDNEKDEKTDEQTAEEDPFVEENQFLAGLNKKQVYDHRLAYIMTNLLKGVISHGSGRRAKNLSDFIGGKTGTTSNYVDAWFLGFSSQVVTGVWAGNDDNTSLGHGESGGRSALPMWKSFMEKAIEYYGDIDFTVPSGIINVSIDKETGKLAKNTRGHAFIEAFVEGTEPGSRPLKTEQDPKDISESILEDDGYYTAQ